MGAIGGGLFSFVKGWRNSPPVSMDDTNFTECKIHCIYCDSSFDAPARPLIRELGWRTIEELIDYEIKTMVFKSLYKMAPEYLGNLFNRNLHAPPKASVIQ